MYIRHRCQEPRTNSVFQILDEAIDIEDIEKRRMLHSLLLCDRQLHDEAWDMAKKKSVFVKVELTCSASLHRAMLNDLGHLIPDLGSGIQTITQGPTTFQQYDMILTMTDPNIKAHKKNTFVIRGLRVLQNFLNFLAGCDPKNKPCITSDPRKVIYNFKFTQYTRKDWLEGSFFTLLSSIWWGFAHVTCEGQADNSLAQATISKSCTMTW